MHPWYVAMERSSFKTARPFGVLIVPLLRALPQLLTVIYILSGMAIMGILAGAIGEVVVRQVELYTQRLAMMAECARQPDHPSVSLCFAPTRSGAWLTVLVF
jgi:hypothetical protein